MIVRESATALSPAAPLTEAERADMLAPRELKKGALQPSPATGGRTAFTAPRDERASPPPAPRSQQSSTTAAQPSSPQPSWHPLPRPVIAPDPRETPAAPAAARSLAVRRALPEEGRIEILIERIEVRGEPVSDQHASSAGRPAPQLALESYLQRQETRRR
jgi:hypothetical protein